MKLSLRVLALALPVVAWSCADNDGATSVKMPPKAHFDVSSGLPLVYDVENTAAAYPKPAFPTFYSLKEQTMLPDPFRFIDGNFDDSFAAWEHHRAEFKASIENYEIGPKPDPSDVTETATFAANTLTVVVTRKSNGQSITLKSPIFLPSGSGPYPAMIGMTWMCFEPWFPCTGVGSLPTAILTSRNIARIPYFHNQVTTYYGKKATDPYFQLYPEYSAPGTVGQYSAWSWGVSRLIDGIQIAAKAGTLPIDTRHLGVTGCSYAGKMAMFAGALDERVALTIAQESGGGGMPAWRVSYGLGDPRGDVEKMNNTDGNWFITSMKTTWAGDKVYRLPHDHHELMAMVAPRALLATNNVDYIWLSNPAAYVSARATQEAYNTLGVGDRFGFIIDGGHGHCQVPASQRPAIEAFVDKFLLGKDANTNVQVNPYPNIDYKAWMNYDRTAPEINSLWASPGVLWPANHEMVSVTLHASVSDNVDPAPVTRIFGVISSEKSRGLADDDIGPDYEITGPMTVNLRAERYGSAPRVYRIMVQSRDKTGNASSQIVTVVVPVNMVED